MISLQKATRLGIAVDNTKDSSKDSTNLIIRNDCSYETIADARRHFGKILFGDLLNADDFDHKVQEIYRSKSLLDDGDLIELGDVISIDDATREIVEQTSIETNEDDAPAIQLLNSIIAQALAKGASDIHIEPTQETLNIKMRLDGNIVNALSLKPQITPRLVSRIKLLGKINISERRLPQDGRVTFKLGNQVIDVRISTLPTGSGERVVMRILGKHNKLIELDKLNMPAKTFNLFKNAIHRPHGLVLVTGPTGSGKTTSLYAAINNISDLGLNIMTIEDPIEINFPKISQTQVNFKLGLGFADGLKAILRQDPDVIMVGEIRDAETASVALRASMTGHLVLSTLHTNTASGAIGRLRDLGVDPYLISSSLNCVLAQRLLRKYCLSCREKSLIEGANKSDQKIKLTGCKDCDYTGLRGRVGVFDYLEISTKMRSEIADGVVFTDLEEKIGKKGLSEEAKKFVSKNIVPKFEAVRMTVTDND